MKHDAAPVDDGAQQQREPAHVEERQTRQPAISLAHAEVSPRRLGASAQVRLGGIALRPPRRSRCRAARRADRRCARLPDRSSSRAVPRSSPPPRASAALARGARRTRQVASASACSSTRGSASRSKVTRPRAARVACSAEAHGPHAIVPCSSSTKAARSTLSTATRSPRRTPSARKCCAALSHARRAPPDASSPATREGRCVRCALRTRRERGG
jgi:hypothetical protein